MAAPLLDSKLMHLFDFTLDDLMSNRKGMMSERQKKGFKRRRDIPLLLFLFIVIMAGIGLLVKGLSMLLGLAWALFVTVLFPIVLLRVLKHGTLAHSQEVKCVDGELHLGGISGEWGFMQRYPIRYYAFIGDVKLPVSPGIAAILKSPDADQYRVY